MTWLARRRPAGGMGTILAAAGAVLLLAGCRSDISVSPEKADVRREAVRTPSANRSGDGAAGGRVRKEEAPAEAAAGKRTAASQEQEAPREVVRGRVTSEGGRPVAGARVSLRRSAGDADSAPASAVTVTTGSGEFVLEGDASGEALLTIVSSTHVPLGRMLFLPTTAPLDLRLTEEGAAVEGQVFLDATGEGVSSVAVSLVPEPGGRGIAPFDPFTTFTDTLGVFRIPRLPGGRYRLEAFQPELRLGLLPAPHNVRSLSLGDRQSTTIELFLYEGFTLSGTARDAKTFEPLAGVRIEEIAPDPALLRPGRGSSDEARPWYGRFAAGVLENRSSRSGSPAHAAAGAFRATGAPEFTSTTTAADGHWTLHGLFPADRAGSPLLLDVTKTGYRLVDKEMPRDGLVQFNTVPETRHLSRDLLLERVVKVSGTIRSRDGTPLSSVTLSLFYDYLRQPGSARPESGAVEPDGRFSVDVSPYLRVRLSASSPGYASGATDLIWVEEKPVENIELVLERGLTLTGTVLDPGGNPVEGAEITAERGTGNYRMTELTGRTRSGPGGAFTLSGQTRGVHLQATCDGYAPSSLHLVEPGAGAPDDIVLRLRAARSISGRVTTKAGEPVRNATVKAASYGESTRGEGTRTDADGRYRLEGLPDGFFVLNALTESLEERGSLSGVQSGRDDADIVLRRNVFRGDKTLIGRVVDAETGDPVTNFEVRGWPIVREGKPNEFAVKERTSSGFDIFLNAPGYAPARFSVRMPRAEEVKVHEEEFRLRRGAAIRGRLVTGEERSPVAGAEVQYWGIFGDQAKLVRNDPVAVVRTDADGRFTVEHAGTDSNHLLFKPEAPLAAREQTVRMDGEMPVDLGEITIGREGEVRVRVVEGPAEIPVPGAGVTISAGLDVRDERSARTDAQGACVFRGMRTPGDFWVRLDNMEVSARGELISGETEEVILRLGGTVLRGAVTWGGVPAAAQIHVYREGESVEEGRQYEAAGDGRFTVHGLTAGRWNIRITLAANYEVRFTDTVEIQEGETELERNFPAPGGEIHGTVADGAGKAVPHATVKILPAAQAVSGEDPFKGVAVTRMPRCDENGVFRQPGLRAGAYLIFAKSREGAASPVVPVEVGPDGLVQVTVQVAADTARAAR